MTRDRIQPDSLRKIKVGNFEVFVNRTHALPRYLRERPSYSANFPRIVSFVRAMYPNLVVLDIGANIGDTVARVRSVADCSMVCIEGNNFFFSILKKNIAQFNNVRAYQYFLGDEDARVETSNERQRGTFSIDKREEGHLVNTVQVCTLDAFLKKEKPCENTDAKVLKIDTDGYDLKILRGGKRFIEENHPILFFEFDRTLLARLGENETDIFSWLQSTGYSKILFYDNTGRFILAAELESRQMIHELYLYTSGKKSAFPYYDVCIFHTDDAELANRCISEEEKINI